MKQNFDVIVIGAGGVGSATAYHLAKAKYRVLLLEQFELDHDKGSSYGYSRVIRYAYDCPIYINLMRVAYPLWFSLQEEAGETLYIKTGGLDFAFKETLTLQQIATSMDETEINYERLSVKEIQKRFPQFNLTEDMEGLYQEDTGILKASKCVLTQTRLAQKYGATLLEKTPVTQIQLGNNVVEVQTSKDKYYAEKIVIAAGSWSKRILAMTGLELPLKIMPCQLAFFQPNNPEDFQTDRFPVFSAQINGDYGEMPYGLPISDGSGVKITTFYGWETVDDITEVDYTPSLEWVEKIRSFCSQYLPSVNGSLVETRRCLYTMTPDKHFVIDTHPIHDNVFIGAGFSGHGFKFTILVGKILGDLAIQGKSEYDTNFFKISRFKEV